MHPDEFDSIDPMFDFENTKDHEIRVNIKNKYKNKSSKINIYQTYKRLYSNGSI